jgi:hypothetical protein
MENQEQDAALSVKHFVVDLRDRYVDDCVIIIRPAPPGSEKPASMVILVDYDKRDDYFVVKSDRPIELGSDWIRNAQSCDSSSTVKSSPRLTGLKDVIVRVSEEGVDNGKNWICLVATTDTNGRKHAKKFYASKKSSFTFGDNEKLIVTTDDPKEPTALVLHYKELEYTISLKKPAAP